MLSNLLLLCLQTTEAVLAKFAFRLAALAWQAGGKTSVTDFRFTVNLRGWTSDKLRETALDLLTLALNAST